jgi:hypothetical protein
MLPRLLLLLPLAIAGALGCGAPDPPELLDPAADVAGRRGLEWILAQEQAQPFEAWLPVVVRAYRLTRDDALAASLAPRIERQLAAHPARCVHEDLERARTELDGLYEVLWDLLRCRDEGRDVGDTPQRLVAQLEREDAIRSLPQGHRLVVAYLLERLGVPTGPASAALRDGILSQCRSRGLSACDLYPVAHVVIVASDYFRRFVDARDFPLEIEIFRTAAANFRQHALDDTTADALGEVLLSFKLMRLPLDGDLRALRERLVARQNPDGSWGAPGLAAEPRFHLSAVLTLALLDHAPAPRRSFSVR